MTKRKLRVQDAEKWLVLSDPHYPFQHKKYIKAIKRFARDLQPDVIVVNGDGLDFYDLSRFNKNPQRRFKLQEEIEEYKHDFLGYWHMAHPTARLYHNEGNHERRVRTYLWHHAPEVSKLKGLTIQEMLFEYEGSHLPYVWSPLETPLQCGKLLIHHGLFARKGGGISAKAMLERYGQSILSGHSHRMGSFFRSDYRGVHAAWEQGCLLDRTQNEYDPQPDWQNGFAVVHMWPKFKGYFKVDLIPLISDRWFLYNDQVYTL